MTYLLSWFYLLTCLLNELALLTFLLAYFITYLFTYLLTCEWKVANTVPIYKKGTKTEVNNYRPDKRQVVYLRAASWGLSYLLYTLMICQIFVIICVQNYIFMRMILNCLCCKDSC